MRLFKILGAGTIALFLALAVVSCDNLTEPEAVPSQAANTSNTGQTNNGQTNTGQTNTGQTNTASDLLSNIRFAVGTNPSVVMAENESNWNPKSVDFLEKVFIAFDVNTNIKIKSLKCIEILNGKPVLEDSNAANLNDDYKDGIERIRIGNSLCIATIIDAGIGNLQYRIEVAFEDGTVSTIASALTQVGRLSNANRISNLRVAPMMDTNEAWDILHTTGADTVEGENGRIAFTMRNWSDTDNIKNIFHVISLKDNGGEYRRWWRGTTGIGNFGERAWAKTENNSLYIPVLKPIGKVKYEVFVNFKDGTTERLEKEITSVAKKYQFEDDPLGVFRYVASAEVSAIGEANKANWNPSVVYLNSTIMVAVDVKTDMKITNVKYKEYIDGKAVREKNITENLNEAYKDGIGRVGKALCFSTVADTGVGEFDYYFQVTFENGISHGQYFGYKIREKPFLSNFRFVAVEMSDDNNANLVKEANRGHWNPTTVRAPIVVLLAADVDIDLKIEKVLYTVYINDKKVYEMSVGKGSESLGGDCNMPYQRQYLKKDYDGIAMYGRLGRVDKAFVLDTSINGGGATVASKLQYKLTFTFENGEKESIFSESTMLY